MPGSRYLEFLRLLAQRRVQAGERSDTMAATICQGAYDDIMYQIVNTVIITRCFDLGLVPGGPKQMRVRLNGQPVPYVGLDCFVHEGAAACEEAGCFWDTEVDAGAGACVKAEEPGWSWEEGSSEICLENGLTKQIGDEFEIFILTENE